MSSQDSLGHNLAAEYTPPESPIPGAMVRTTSDDFPPPPTAEDLQNAANHRHSSAGSYSSLSSPPDITRKISNQMSNVPSLRTLEQDDGDTSGE